MKAYSKSGDGERKTKKLRPSVKLRRLLKLRSRLPRVPAKVDSHEGVDRVYMDFSDQEPHPPDGVIHVASCSPAVLSDGTAKFIAACLNDIDAVEGVLDENAKLREAVRKFLTYTRYAPTLKVGEKVHHVPERHLQELSDVLKTFGW